MPTNNPVGNFFVPEILADQITAGFAGAKALWGTGAAVINTKMPHGPAEVGTAVKIPYFTNIGEWQDVGSPADYTGDATVLTGVTLNSTPQLATVYQAGLLVQRTQWAQLAALSDADPYEVMAAQAVEGAMRKIDLALINTAASATGWSGMTYDSTGVGAGTMTYDSIINAKRVWGDERADIALVVVHSKVMFDLEQLKDSTGRPLLTAPDDDGVSKIAGISIAVSDRIPNASGTYSNLVMKKGALAAWLNGDPLQMSNNDPTTGTFLDSWHMFYATHRYNPMQGRTKGGVARLLTK